MRFQPAVASIFLISTMSCESSQPPPKTDHVAEGRALLTEGKTNEAIRQFSAAIKNGSNPRDALQYRAEAFLEAGDAGRAIADVEKLLKLEPGRAEARYLLGSAYRRQAGQEEKALEAFTGAIERQPDMVKAFVDRSATYFALNRLQEAIADCNEALNLDPLNARVLVNRGVYLSRLGERGKANADWERAIDLAPQLPGGYFSRGVDRGAHGEFDLAIVDMSKVLELRPDHMPARQNRAAAYEALEQYDAALADYDTLLSRAPNAPPLLERRAAIYRKLGRDDEAEKDELRAAAAAGTTPR